MPTSHKTPEVEPVVTADGSSTGRHVGTGATYRSVFGALTEVRHVFIESTGLKDATDSWKVIELGFGLGTSFVETARMATELGVALTYISVEREPAAPELVQHDWELGRSLAMEALARLEDQDRATVREAGLHLTIQRTDWLDAALGRGADAVYFDPFGPSVNPESWTDESFAVALEALAPAGRLATYSAAGHVRRALARSGFHLATRPGPGRKREITVASPTVDGLGDYERLSRDRYNREES